MNLELFIAKRIHFGGEKGEKRVSTPAIKIAIAGVAIGIAAMILAISIVIGFKQEVRNKVVGFGSHIQITNIENNNSYETRPICVNDTLINQLKSRDNIKHVERYATKSSIIKTDDSFQGVVLKGIDKDYDWSFFQQNMEEGTVLNLNDTSSINQALVSRSIANKLNLKVGDSFVTYFVQEPIKARKFEITGIYNTNFEDYDKIFVITNIELIQKVNDWESDQVSGLELIVNDYNQLDATKQEVFLEMMTYRDKFDNTFYTRSIQEINPMIFSWLDLLDMNVWVIIILMFAISVFTMVSGLLIIILERTQMIGILKVLGAKNFSIRKTFLYVSSFLVLKGMVIGNLIAFAIIFGQKYFGFIKLSPETYYVSEMPVEINIPYFILINVCSLILSITVMVAPSYLIAKISPVKAIKFD